ncbi:MAG UNVERIFIED_CONTAM: hypothetical protein LVR18_21480 [Planctomycetaceae bacterium]
MLVASLSILLTTGGLSADDLRYSSAGDGAVNLFQFPPQTPEELVEAVRISIRLDRPADARGFLRQLLERDPRPRKWWPSAKNQGWRHSSSFAAMSGCSPKLHRCSS